MRGQVERNCFILLSGSVQGEMLWVAQLITRGPGRDISEQISDGVLTYLEFCPRLSQEQSDCLSLLTREMACVSGCASPVF